ncbi:MAG: hypothetical protein AAFS10_04595 [Myxococcota bacterium]
MNQLMSVIETRVRTRLGLDDHQSIEHPPLPPATTPPAPTLMGQRLWPPALPPEPLPSPEHLIHILERSVLAPDVTLIDLEAQCMEVRNQGYRAICVHPNHVARTAALLSGCDAWICAAIDPNNTLTTATKAFAAQEAAHLGAHAIEMALDHHALWERDHRHVLNDIRTVVEAVPDHPLTLHLGAALAHAPTTTMACTLAKAAGAAAVHTGVLDHTALIDVAEQLAHIRSVLGDDVGIKASLLSGDPKDMFALLNAGVSHISTPQGGALMGNTTPETPNDP